MPSRWVTIMHVKICQEHTIYIQYCNVLQPLYLPLLTVPGGPPENFTVDVISSTGIQLMWQPPPSEIQNGRVRLYTISVFEVQTGNNYSYTLQPSEAPTLQVESLHPYYDYVCSVAAVTIGPGPYTSPLTVRTFEDGECLPFFDDLL